LNETTDYVDNIFESPMLRKIAIFEWLKKIKTRGILTMLGLRKTPGS
jgi:hypothetical protein